MGVDIHENPLYNSKASCERERLQTCKYGILAQLGEHLPYKQRVIGSSPIGPIDIKEYGEIAQLARAHGSYPWCRGFESPSRYYNEKSVDLNLRSADFFVQS